MNPFEKPDNMIEKLTGEISRTGYQGVDSRLKAIMKNYQQKAIEKRNPQETQAVFWDEMDNMIRELNCRWIWKRYDYLNDYLYSVDSIANSLPEDCHLKELENKIGYVIYTNSLLDFFNLENESQLYLPLTSQELFSRLNQKRIDKGIDHEILSIYCEHDEIGDAVMNLCVGARKQRESLNIYEINYLFHLVSKMSNEERSVYCHTLKLHPPQSIEDMINLTANIDKVCIASNIYTTNDLGEFLIENDFYDFDEKFMPFLDFSKLAEKHMAENKGILDTRTGQYIEDTAMPKERVVIYDGKHIPVITESGIEEYNEPELDTSPIQQ